jgi:hypothetical protein
MRRSFVMAAAILVCVVNGAHAQTRAVDDHVRVVVNGGGFVNPERFGQDFTIVKNVENALVTTDMKPGASGFVEVGARARITRALWIGVVGFTSSGSATGTLDAEVPHPFYFDQPRPVTGDLKRHTTSTTGAHVELVYAVPAGRNSEIAVFGGPSYISLEQQLVTDFTFTDSYPFDTADFEAETKATTSRDGVGFNVGADAMWRFGRIWLGGIVRYSLVNLTLSPAAGNEVEMKAGGIQAGAGVRVGF